MENLIVAGATVVQLWFWAWVWDHIPSLPIWYCFALYMTMIFIMVVVGVAIMRFFDLKG